MVITKYPTKTTKLVTHKLTHQTNFIIKTIDLIEKGTKPMPLYRYIFANVVRHVLPIIFNYQSKVGDVGVVKIIDDESHKGRHSISLRLPCKKN